VTAKCVDAPLRPAPRTQWHICPPPFCYATVCKILYSISN